MLVRRPLRRLIFHIILFTVVKLQEADRLDGFIIEEALNGVKRPVLVKDVYYGAEAERLMGGGGQAEVLHLNLLGVLQVTATLRARHGVVNVVNQLDNLVIIQLFIVSKDQTEPLDHPHLVDAFCPGLRDVQEGRAMPDKARTQARDSLLDAHGLVDDAVVDLGKITENRDNEVEDDETGNLVPDQHVRDEVDYLRAIHIREGPTRPELDLETVVLPDLGLAVHVQNVVDPPRDPVSDRLDGHAADLARVLHRHLSVASA
mmetsp:Transcript_57298/g.153440  ORF Transcript_57298/g.153440 Transcript_57298/m.153440 type:complete len:260 (-) Transcript_57298:978-1757(-)